MDVATSKVGDGHNNPVANAESVPESAAGSGKWTVLDSKPLSEGRVDLIVWEGKRLLRVWTPPGYSGVEGRAAAPYPVLYLNDGQNLFDPKRSFSGSCWLPDTCSKLIQSGQLPPFVVVGIDHVEATRSLDYTPYKPGTGPGGVRKDAADWPGGGVKLYLERVVQEVIPFISRKYYTAIDPAQVAFGGASFGGICALCAAMQFPHVFGSVLVESPSLWLANEKFLNEDLVEYKGPWPQYSTWLAMGTREYTGIHPDDPQPEWDKRLAKYIPRLAEIIEEKGVAADAIKWEVVEGATHNDNSWAERLPRALTFLLAHW